MNFIKLGLLSTFLSSSCLANERPNIILLMADDLGWGDPSYNDGWIQTPALDTMAAEGLRFDRFYAASAVCSPTRGSCLTGRNPLRLGIPFANEGRIEADETLLSEILDAEGYATGHFGKWHLGTLTTLRQDSNRGALGNSTDFSPPWQHGYDFVFATEAKVPTFHPMRLPVNGLAEPVDSLDPNFHGTFYWNAPTDPATWPDAAEGEPVAFDDNLSGDDSRIIMDRVIPFIQDAVTNSEPFFTVIWLHTPHRDVVDPGGLSPVDSADAYTNAIVDMDTQIARLRAELTNLGVSDDTMLWFCSDNGPEEGVGRPGPYRARKRSLYEGGVRVPGILVWPNKIPTGQVTDFPAVTSDYYPTITDYLCLEVPNQKPLDGISLRGVIEGTDTEREEPIGFSITSQRSWVNQQYKLFSNDNGSTFELYDLIADETETTNIADANPDIVAAMTAEFQAWQTAVDNDLPFVTPADAPTVELTSALGPVQGPFEVTVVFSESVTSLLAEDFEITNGTASALTGSGSEYTFTVPPTNPGLVSVTLPAGSAEDTDANPTLVSNILSVFFGESAPSILIDFGRTDNQTLEGNFNNIFGTGTGLDTPTVDLIDSTGATTGITIDVDFSTGGSWAGSVADYNGPYPAEVAAQPMTAIQDSMFIRAPARTTLFFTGLDQDLVYNILLYSARSNNGGPNSEWTVTDNSGDTLIALDVFNNESEVAWFQELTPDANGQLVLVSTTTDDGSRPRGAINFMEITVGALSEPTPLEITNIELNHTGDSPSNTLTWNAISGSIYAVSFSTDLQIWEEITDSVVAEGTSTSFQHDLQPFFTQLIDAPVLFYRVQVVE